MARLAGVETEFTRAEFDKYGAPLLLLHGLWTGPWVWRVTAGYLAHLGWSSYAPAWRGAATNWDELVALADRAAAELGNPVVIGHDLGGLAALQVCGVRAAVALAPLPCGPAAPRHPGVSSLTARLTRWRRGALRPSEKEARRLLGLEAAKLEAEPAVWFDEIERVEMRDPGDGTPRLIVAGGADPCLPRQSAALLAAATGAKLSVHAPVAHDLPYGVHWQTIVAEVHRWLVHRLGESVVLLRGDEDLRDD